MKNTHFGGSVTFSSEVIKMHLCLHFVLTFFKIFQENWLCCRVNVVIMGTDIPHKKALDLPYILPKFGKNPLHSIWGSHPNVSQY